MSVWLALRFAKFVGVVLFGAGVLGAVLPRDPDDRRFAVYALATPGLVLTWLAGYGLARETGISLGSAWISASIALGLALFQLVVWWVERDRAGRAIVAAVAIAALAGTLGLMVARPGTRTAPVLEAHR